MGGIIIFLKDDTFQSCTNLEFLAEKKLKGGTFQKITKFTKNVIFIVRKCAAGAENIQKKMLETTFFIVRKRAAGAKKNQKFKIDITKSCP